MGLGEILRRRAYSMDDPELGEAFDRLIERVRAEARAEQREKDAQIAEAVHPLGVMVLGDAPSKIAEAIRAGGTR